MAEIRRLLLYVMLYGFVWIAFITIEMTQILNNYSMGTGEDFGQQEIKKVDNLFIFTLL